MGRLLLNIASIAVILISLLIGTATVFAERPQVCLEGDKSIYCLMDTRAYGAGGLDVFLLYADTTTYTGWTKTWGRPANEYPKGLTTDQSGNALVCGDYGFAAQDPYVARPGFVVKFNTSGDLVWARDLVWSDFTIFLEDVACDSGNNVYVTGMAWRYESAPGSDGLYAYFGFIFTVKLDSTGEVIWAKRWNVDERDAASGRSIITDGNEVVVAGQHFSRPSEETFSDNYIMMLWYNAATGDLNASQSWGIVDADSDPYSMCYGTGNEVYVGGGIMFDGQCEALLLHYSPGHYLQDAQAWGGTGLDFISDLDVLGSTVYAVGRHEVGKHPPELGSDFEAPAYDGLCLVFDKGLLISAEKSHDILDNNDSWFSAVAARTDDDVWIAGHGGFGQSSQRHEPATGSSWYVRGDVGHPTPREETPCGANSFPIDNATVTTPMTLGEFINYMPSQNMYLSQVNWSDPPHTPDVKLRASDTSGPAPLTVTFDASDTIVVNGAVANFSWNFGPPGDITYEVDTGLTSTTTHTFDAPGTYLAAVQVTSDDGSMMWEYIQITVN